VEPSGEYHFDGWTFRERSGELLRAGNRVLLQSQAVTVLRELLQQPGQLVTRAQLIAKLWPRGVVEYDTALNSAVRRLRSALGDHADAPRYIETIPKRGYRFIGCLEKTGVTVDVAVTPPATVPPRRQPWLAAAVLVIAVGAVASVSSFRPDPPDGAAAKIAPGGQAQEDYLLARHFYAKRTPADLKLARRHFEQAVEVDPQHAGAWAGLASVNWIDTVEGRLAPGDGLPEVRAAAERALAIDPAMVEAHLRLAGFYRRTGDPAEGDEHYRLAVSLEPDNPLVLSFAAGTAAWEGRLDEAARLQRRSVEADPLLVPGRWNLVTYLYLAGRWDEAEEEILELRELVPGHREVAVRLADLAILDRRYAEALDLTRQMSSEADRLFARTLAYHGLGRKAESDAALEALFDSMDEEQAFRIAEALAFRGERELAFAWLRASESDLEVPWIRYSPFLRTLQADPRWAEWMDSVRNRRPEPVGMRRKG